MHPFQNNERLPTLSIWFTRQYLKQKRNVPEYCCDIWDCKPELFCINDETGERVPVSFMDVHFTQGFVI